MSMGVPHHFDQWRDHRASELGERPASCVFVFSGGGLNGAAQAGMVRELLAAGVYPDAVVGVSAGAMNAVYLASTPFDIAGDGLVKIWEEVGREGIFDTGSPERLWAVVRHHASIDSGSRLAAIIERNTPVDDLSECVIPIRVGTLNLESSSMEWHDRGDAKLRLRASTALPGIFPPVVLNGDRHVDGGVGSPVPLGAAIEFQPTTLVVLDVSLMESHPRDASENGTEVPRQSALGILLSSFDAARHRVALAEQAMITRDVETITIRAGIPGGLLPETAHQVPKIIELGAAAAREALTHNPHLRAMSTQPSGGRAGG
jgi:NTE family protein